MHPLAFLVRRLVYSAIALFCISEPLIGIQVLSTICVVMICFIIVEQQWEDSLIATQHIINEVALYLILMIVTMFALPLSASAQSSIGWLLISIVIATLVFNMAIIGYYSVFHFTLFMRRHRKRINNIVDILTRKQAVSVAP